MPADRHRQSPRAVRIPADLETWYVAYAEEHDVTVHAALVGALEVFRATVESSAACGAPQHAPAAGGAPQNTVPQTKFVDGQPACDGIHHPVNRLIGGVCMACGRAARATNR